MEFDNINEFKGKISTLNLQKGDVLFIRLTNDITHDIAHSIVRFKDEIEEKFGFSVPVCVISDKISGINKLEPNLAETITMLKNKVSII